MSEEEEFTLEEISRWATEGVSGIPFVKPETYWGELFFRYYLGPGYYGYMALKRAVDPFIPDLQTFFSNVYTWIVTKWGQLWNWIEGFSKDLELLFSDIINTLWGVYEWLEQKFDALVNLIWNSFTLLWSQLVVDLTEFVNKIVAPLVKIFDFFTVTLVEWYEYIRKEIAKFLEDPKKWIEALGDKAWESIKWMGGEIWDVMLTAANAVSAWIGEKITALAPQVTEYLRDVLFWLWEVIKDTYVFVAEQIAPAVFEATTGALGWLKDQFTYLIGTAYDELMDYAKSFVPMTPAKSVEAAKVMFGSAVGFGALAHGMALGVEMLPQLKYMGVHYLSAFTAHMGGFGLISTATMGVIATLALRVPFTYYMNDLLRPSIPDDKLLIEFRAKRELDFSQFKRYMAFHGHSDEWTQKIDSWLWKDPRLFEILYCADVTVPPREWLVRKFERAGYEDVDVDVLCRVVDRRTTRSPRTYFTSAMRRNFRHGFLSEQELETGIEDLEMAKEGVTWIKRAGELDVIYETYSDLVTAYRTAFRNDVITEGECLASLAALGLPKVRSEAIVFLEWVRKYPRATKAERKEIEEPWAELQAEYSRAYIESFRRGLITQDELAAYLVAIGIEEKLARVTAFFEALKLVPKPKPEEIPAPVIPIAPKPPTYES